MLTPYAKTDWADRDVQYPRRYLDQALNQYTFTPDEGVITNAGTPVTAGVMNKLEKAIYEGRGSAHDLDYWRRRNTQIIASCEASESGWANNSWAGNVGTYAADGYPNYVTGSSSAKLNGGTAQNTGIHCVKAMDLTSFEDSGVSTTDDYICFVLFIDATSIGRIGSLEFAFCNNAYSTYTDAKYYRISTAGLSAGKNIIKIKKSSFGTYGAGAWSGISGFDLHAFGSPSGAISFTLDCIFMCRKDPVADAPNPFQRLINNTWTNEFTVGVATDLWFVGKEWCISGLYAYGKTIVKNLNPTNSATGSTAAALKSAMPYYDRFLIAAKFKVLTDDYCAGIGWEIDANNRIMCKISADTLYLYTTSAGVDDTSVSAALGIEEYDSLFIVLSRSGTTVTCQVFKDGYLDTNYGATEQLLTKEVSFSSTSAGYLVVGSIANKYSILESIGITNTEFVYRSAISQFAEEVAVQPIAKITRSTAQSIPNTGVDTQIQFSTADFDTHGMINLTNYGIRIRKTGVYRISLKVYWVNAGDATGARSVTIKDSLGYTLGLTTVAGVTISQGQEVTCEVDAIEGSEIYGYAAQTGAGSINIGSTSTFYISLSVQKIG